MDLYESGWMVRGTLVRCALSILRSPGSSVRSRTQARGIGPREYPKLTQRSAQGGALETCIR